MPCYKQWYSWLFYALIHRFIANANTDKWLTTFPFNTYVVMIN